jgi:DNA-binding NtrC family response regulator
LLPPLRHRTEDIPILAEHFLRIHASQNSAEVEGFTAKTIAKLVQMRWEGNVRELENVLERAVVLAAGEVIDVRDLPDYSQTDSEEIVARAPVDLLTLDELNHRYVQFVLAKTGGRKDQAAQILGINRRTLYRWEKIEATKE